MLHRLDHQRPSHPDTTLGRQQNHGHRQENGNGTTYDHMSIGKMPVVMQAVMLVRQGQQRQIDGVRHRN